MIEQILHTIKKYNMLTQGDSVIVGLSGGADSVCLLLSLFALRDRLDISVSAMHVNHCLRGAESDSDENFCRDLCDRLKIPFVSGRFDVISYAAKTHKSTEQAARDIRYDFFHKCAAGKKIATAHNANDNAETMIFNLTRGTGTKGICGIPPVRDNIIRPLIETSRDQIEQYLAGLGQMFVTDKTNLSDDYTRNKIRHNVIPVLRSLNTSLFRTFTSNSDNFRLDNSYIEQQADTAYMQCLTPDGKLSGLDGYHKAVRHRCIARLLNEHSIEPDNKKITETDMICLNGGKINLSKNVYIISKSGILYIDSVRTEKNDYFEAHLNPGSNDFKSIKTVNIILHDVMPDTVNPVIDADRVSDMAVLRTRKPGDKIRLNGRGFTSSVKKLLNEKTSLSERDNICFISDEQGPLFIEGIGISERAACGSFTRKFMEINIKSV